MAKILLSWLATFNDFVDSSLEVKTDGPHYGLYETYFKQTHKDFDFEHHILFHSESPHATTRVAQKALAMARTLKNDFREVNTVVTHHEEYKSHKEKMGVVADIEIVCAGLKDIIDLEEIYNLLRKFLQHPRFQGHELYFLCGTGTAAMQTAFILAHQNIDNFESSLVFLEPQRQGVQFEGTVKVVQNDILKVSDPSAAYFIKQGSTKKNTQKPTDTLLKGTETKKVFDNAAAIASSHQEVDFLILGETGVGKEVLARHIHDYSGVKGEFTPVNCAAITETLLQSELFGHIQGAFTDATRDRTGYFEKAKNGTVFLDEIGDISPKMQVALLRVLQERKITKVGSSEEIPVKVNVIAATNRDLEEMVEQGTFREDLYYRLAVVPLEVPPLRERSQKELEKLIAYFIDQYPRAKRISFHKKALQKISQYEFSGNIRELKHLIEQLVLTATNPEIKLQELPPKIRYGKYKVKYLGEYVLAKHIYDVHQACQRNNTQTAKKVGKSVNGMKTYLNTYQLYTHLDRLRAKYRYEDAKLLKDLVQLHEDRILDAPAQLKFEACLGEEVLKDRAYIRDLMTKLKKLNK